MGGDVVPHEGHGVAGHGELGPDRDVAQRGAPGPAAESRLQPVLPGRVTPNTPTETYSLSYFLYRFSFKSLNFFASYVPYLY